MALHEVGNPGNLGTIIRTASAAGAAGVILIGPAADPYDPAAVKASMGALFDVPVAAGRPARGVPGLGGQPAGHGRRRRRRAASVPAGRPSSRPPLAILLGSEGEGLPGLLDCIDRAAGQQVRIPMVGTAESLNLAVAAGILLYEVRRRTGLPPARPGRRPWT